MTATPSTQLLKSFRKSHGLGHVRARRTSSMRNHEFVMSSILDHVYCVMPGMWTCNDHKVNQGSDKIYRVPLPGFERDWSSPPASRPGYLKNFDPSRMILYRVLFESQEMYRIPDTNRSPTLEIIPFRAMNHKMFRCRTGDFLVQFG